MDRESVRSSNLKSVGYDSTSSTLGIEFKSLSVYQYFSVSVEIFDGLLTRHVSIFTS